MTDLEYQGVKDWTIAQTKKACQKWLREMVFWYDGQTIPGLMKDLAKYRGGLTPESKPSGLEWAAMLISKAADGKEVSHYALKLAKEAIEAKERRFPPINKAAYAGE